MAQKNKDYRRFLWLQFCYYQNVNRNGKKKPSTIYTLQDLFDDRKYIKALMVAKKKKTQPKKLVHVKIARAA